MRFITTKPPMRERDPLAGRVRERMLTATGCIPCQCVIIDRQNYCSLVQRATQCYPLNQQFISSKRRDCTAKLIKHNSYNGFLCCRFSSQLIQRISKPHTVKGKHSEIFATVQLRISFIRDGTTRQQVTGFDRNVQEEFSPRNVEILSLIDANSYPKIRETSKCTGMGTGSIEATQCLFYR